MALLNMKLNTIHVSENSISKEIFNVVNLEKAKSESWPSLSSKIFSTRNVLHWTRLVVCAAKLVVGARFFTLAWAVILDTVR